MNIHFTAWNKFKITRDPDQVGAICMLLEWQEKMGARKLYDHKYLNDFCAWTGYKKKSFSRFQDDLSMFKDKFGGKRKDPGWYISEQLVAAAARAAKKGFNGKR